MVIVGNLSLPGDRTLSKFLSVYKQEGVSCNGDEVLELYYESANFLEPENRIALLFSLPRGLINKDFLRVL